MKLIEKIDITFENCESITLPQKVLGECYLGDIKTEIYRVASNVISKVTYANEVALEIFFPEAEELGNKSPLFDKNDTIFDRLMRHNDITHITLTYDDNSIEEYCVNYIAENCNLGAQNLNQSTIVSQCGNIYIVISEIKDIKDYFNLETINDKELMNYDKSMICN